jgi:hypothetical protein
MPSYPMATRLPAVIPFLSPTATCIVVYDLIVPLNLRHANSRVAAVDSPQTRGCDFRAACDLTPMSSVQMTFLLSFGSCASRCRCLGRIQHGSKIVLRVRISAARTCRVRIKVCTYLAPLIANILSKDARMDNRKPGNQLALICSSGCV